MIITLDHVNHILEIKNETSDGSYTSKISYANIQHTEAMKEILENIFDMMCSDNDGLGVMMQEIEEDDVQTVIGEW